MDRARQWKSIRKFRVGSGQGQAEHADAHNVRGLVLEAYESASRMLAFIRDADDEAERVDAIRRALDTLDALGFSDAFGYQLEVVGGTVAPTLESWILCLHGRYKHADMSVSRAASAITTAGIELKSTAAYVAIADTGALPTHDCSLKRWLDQAREAFARLIDGAPR